MKVGLLFSGGKDSCFACLMAMREEDVACLITLNSLNPESYMFHTPNIHLTEIQAKAIDLPLVQVKTEGEKEEELKDLKIAMEMAKENHGIKGIITGAVLSVYQTTRIQRICNDLNLWCFNPLWQANQLEYMRGFISSGFKALISGVFAYPFDKFWLGKVLDKEVLDALVELSENHGISITGEGGEYETFVFDGPIFRKKVEIKEFFMEYKNYSGTYKINKTALVEKNDTTH
jgi:ABC transporter with metal-binding/Fe-S-binding domain ATP-binding protein